MEQVILCEHFTDIDDFNEWGRVHGSVVEIINCQVISEYRKGVNGYSLVLAYVVFFKIGKDQV